MTKFFVANTTKQNHNFVYRLPEMQNASPRMIRAGEQVLLGDFSSEQIAAIVKQQERYGIRDAGAMSTLKGFVGISYRLEKPVPLDRMLEVIDSNDKTLDRQAERRREATAAAISQNLGNELHKRTGADPDRLRPERVEVATVEDTKGKPSLDVGVEVPSSATARPRKASQRAHA